MQSDKPARSELRSNLEHRCRFCKYCHGEGVVQIFHDRYDGQPYVEQKDDRGRLSRFALTGAVSCICPLGDWILSTRQEEATALREIQLQRVIEGRVPWSMTDPTLPYIDDSEEVKPGAFREMLAKIPNVARRASDVERDRRKRERENWLVRFLVNALDAGPMLFDDLVQRARDAGHGSIEDMRSAGELVRIKIASMNGQETWMLE